MSLSSNTKAETTQDTSTGSGVFSISESSFICIAQNNLINLLMKTTDKKSDIVKIQDNYYKSSECDCAVFFQSLKSIDLRLFLFFVSKLCSLFNIKNRDRAIRITVKEYQELTNQKDYCNTNRQMKESISRLESVCLSQKSFSCHLFESVTAKRGSFIIAYDEDFFKLISDEKKGFLTYIPASLFKINLQKDDLSFFLAYKLLTYQRIRASKKQDANLISVRSLLSACPNLDLTHQHKTRRIIEPVAEALDRLTENIKILSFWDYDSENADFSYSLFEESSIRFDFSDEINAQFLEHKAKKRK